MATGDAVREQIGANIREFQTGKRMQLVACVDGGVVRMVIFVRDDHPPRAHRGGLFSLVTAACLSARATASVKR
jgi:methylglyoxal synthase